MLKHLIAVFILLGTIACSTADVTDNTPTTGLAVTFTTSTTGGGYSPRNIVAIWIETESGVFVKSLTVKAAARKHDLTRWNTSSKGDVTDAVTGATLSNYGTISSYWNGKNASGTLMPDGIYKVCMEITDKSNPGNYSTFNFNKSSTATTLTPTNQPSFNNISIKWTPL